MLIIRRPRRRWLGCRSSRLLWRSAGASGLFESCEELLYFTGLLESVVNRLYNHCSVRMKSVTWVGPHSLEEHAQVVQEGAEQVVSMRGSQTEGGPNRWCAAGEVG